MQNNKHIRSFTKRLTLYAVLFGSLLVIALPAIANTRNWSFIGTIAGEYINGEKNGVYHYMTAGNLTNNGSLWSTNWSPSTNLFHWTFRVWKDNGWLDQQICTIVIAPNAAVNTPVYFSQSCGYISAGNYYLEAWRGGSDGRAYSASGSFVTP